MENDKMICRFCKKTVDKTDIYSTCTECKKDNGFVEEDNTPIKDFENAADIIRKGCGYRSHEKPEIFKPGFNWEYIEPLVRTTKYFKFRDDISNKEIELWKKSYVESIKSSISDEQKRNLLNGVWTEAVKEPEDKKRKFLGVEFEKVGSGESFKATFEVNFNVEDERIYRSAIQSGKSANMFNEFIKRYFHSGGIQKNKDIIIGGSCRGGKTYMNKLIKDHYDSEK